MEDVSVPFRGLYFLNGQSNDRSIQTKVISVPFRGLYFLNFQILQRLAAE